MSIRIRVYVIAALFSLQAPVSLAWNLEYRRRILRNEC
ncbi:putative conjugative transfer protein TraH [Orientia tsutsugamushi str. Ikeda]|uniref:Putative conjugative transfer protein TraH n=1 Tax=Orientia tsutsugamushi (strain Ikeda) TaxID=334380 RepID=B3CUZ5_ORITI|nr:putative conjugative transfer protein TraH [Orientia tsutsugamushi str. Ikeda]